MQNGEYNVVCFARPRHDILDAYGGYIINLGSGLPYINTTADIEAHCGCAGVMSGNLWLVHRQRAVHGLHGWCVQQLIIRPQHSSLKCFAHVLPQSHVTGQLAVAQFQDNV